MNALTWAACLLLYVLCWVAFIGLFALPWLLIGWP